MIFINNTQTKQLHCIAHCMKPLLISIIVFVTSAPALAATYRYDGDMPPAKMALDMMEVMGAIERVPDHPGYSPYSAYGNRQKGFSGWGNNGFPGGMSSLYGLPMNNMGGMNALSGMSGMYNPWMMQGMNPAMSMQSMNPAMTMPQGMNQFGNMSQGMYPPAPATGNGSSLWDTQGIQQQMSNGTLENKLDEVTRMLRNMQGQQNTQGQQATQYPATATQPQNAGTNSIDGLWMSSGRDKLQVSGNRFMWTDAAGNTHQGSFSVSGNQITTRVPAYNSTMTYRYQLDGDRMLAETDNGLRYEFTRVRQ